MSPCTHAFFILAMVTALGSGVPVEAEPSAELAAALNTSRPAARVPASNPLVSITSLLRSAGAKFSIGYESVAKTKWDLKSGDVPAGTLKEQIDSLASAAGYEYQANGDWLNFIPKSVANDPNYVMNKRLPGEVEVSPTPYATSIKAWMVANGISCARVLCGMRAKIDYSKIAGNRIVLKDPTVREHMNARNTVYGTDGYSVHIDQMPDPANPGRMLTVMTEMLSTLWSFPYLEPDKEEK